MTPDYGFRVTVAPTSEPVTLAEARAHCRITTPDEDALLAAYIFAARKHVEHHTGLLLMPQTVEMTLDAFPDSDYFELARAPVQSVSSVTYVDSAGSVQAWPAANYVVDQYRHRPALRLAYGAAWPTARAQPNAIVITFLAGFSVISPEWEPIRQAMLMLVGHFFENREAVNVGGSVNEYPLAVDALLSTFRINWF